MKLCKCQNQKLLNSVLFVAKRFSREGKKHSKRFEISSEKATLGRREKVCEKFYWQKLKNQNNEGLTG